MRQRAGNLLERIDGRLRSAKKKEQLQIIIMDENQSRKPEKQVIKRKRRAKDKSVSVADTTTYTVYS